MQITAAEIEQTLAELAKTPDRLASVTRGLAEARLQVKPDIESWSANDILAHLRSCADVWGRSIQAMITRENPTLRHVSPRTRMRKTNYRELEFHGSLETFASQRADLLKLLRPLEIISWMRGATFTGTVRGREQTVFSYARRMAQHKDEHCQQIEALMRSM